MLLYLTEVDPSNGSIMISAASTAGYSISSINLDIINNHRIKFDSYVDVARLAFPDKFPEELRNVKCLTLSNIKSFLASPHMDEEGLNYVHVVVAFLRKMTNQLEICRLDYVSQDAWVDSMETNPDTGKSVVALYTIRSISESDKRRYPGSCYALCVTSPYTMVKPIGYF